MKPAKRWLVMLVLALLLFAGTSTAHRMMMGYRVNELQINAMYDDGTPAQGVKIEVYEDGEPYAEGSTDSKGRYIFRPDEARVEDLTFVSTSAGHRAEISLNLEEEREGAGDMPVPMKVAAGFGYLIGLAGISMIYVSRKKR